MSAATHNKNVFSDEDDDSDDMGTNKPQTKPNKKRKRNAIKRFDDEQHATNTNTATAAIASKDHSHVKFMRWEQKELFKEEHNRLTNYWQPIRKKALGDHKKAVPAGSTSSQASQHAHQQKASSGKANIHKQQQQQQTVDDDESNNVAIDSDEETETIRMAIEQNRPHPLGCRQVYYVRRKREYHKLRDILLEAITPKVNPSTSTVSTATNTTTTST
ncbi:hypothetical protein MUCCIDRAFT_108770 [Mucor lusitanicus CBS 277.49]|uniref:Uncharacterized protein n=1 Tax=Mucor lusitanicus CBS 277.49 TaxID=747725 RepID=A0A162RFY0_MUCCL|nr:hypothetical protein MUCCIDRAFT_108770 [Mucor lusitanicus CBS 277.49]